MGMENGMATKKKSTTIPQNIESRITICSRNSTCDCTSQKIEQGLEEMVTCSSSQRHY
jgi:hypothetical protein